MISNQKSKAHKGTAVIAAAFVLFAAMPVYAGTPDAPTVTVTPGTAATDWTNQSATVSFSVQDYKVTAGPCTNGTLELSADRAKATDTVTVTPKPTEEFMIEEIFVNGASIGTATSFEMPAQDTEVTAKFKAAMLVLYPGYLDDGYWNATGNGYELTNGGGYVSFPAGVYKTATIEVNVSMYDYTGGAAIVCATRGPDRDWPYTELKYLASGRYSGTVTRVLSLRPNDTNISVLFTHDYTENGKYTGTSGATFNLVKITLKS